jgi:ELWxxDGT repeat protein
VEDATPGVQLYRTDGTAAGTFTLPAPGGIDATSFFEFNGRAVFIAADVNGTNLRLMISDGTVPGTRVVPTTTSLYPLALSAATRFGESVFFVAARDNTSLGNYLYRFDGTRLLPVMRLFTGQGVATLYTAGQWLFIQRSGIGPDLPEDGTLWQSDGTAAGTVRVRKADSDADPRFDVCFAGASTLLAVAPTDPANPDDLELWAVDADGVARLLRDVRPGPAGSDISFLANAGPYTYFTADDGTNGRELWRTDGTTAGTRIVRDLAIGGASIEILSFSVANDRLYFTVADGRGGSALYRTDGTYSRTVRLTPATAAALGMQVRSLTPMGDRMLFVYRASGSDAWDWWLADASSTAATELTTLSVPPSVAGGVATLIGQNLYLSSSQGGGSNANELWRIYPDA